MKLFRKWFISQAPVWAKAFLQSEIEQIRRENDRLKAENKALNAYIDGLENGIRGQRRIVIYGGGEKK